MYTVQHMQIVHVRLFQNDYVKLVTGWFFLRRLKVLAHNVNCLGFCNGNSYMHPVHDTVLFCGCFYSQSTDNHRQFIPTKCLILKYCNICNDPGNMVTRFYFKILFILSLICGFI